MAALVGVALVGVTGAWAGFGSSAEYRGGATPVVKKVGEPPKLDRGRVICRPERPSTGGACIPFDPAYDSIGVLDDIFGQEVAFQVCIDNNGDSACGGAPREQCTDDQFFSHDDAGNFFNPLGPLPQGFRPGCPGGPFRGYVVFLCEGVHIETPGAHAHPTTTGTVTGTAGGTGFGNFCQVESETPTKFYEVE